MNDASASPDGEMVESIKPEKIKDEDGTEYFLPRWFEKTVEYKFLSDAIAKKLFSFTFPLDGNHERIGDTIFSKNLHYIIIEFKKTLSDLSGEYDKYKPLPPLHSDSDEAEAKSEPDQAMVQGSAEAVIGAGKSDRDNFVAVIGKLKTYLEKFKSEDREISGHHLLVGGEFEEAGLDESGKQKYVLGLKIAKYFSAANMAGSNNRWDTVDIKKMMDGAVPEKLFNDYVLELFKYKKLKKKKTDVIETEVEDDGGGSGGSSTIPVAGQEVQDEDRQLSDEEVAEVRKKAKEDFSNTCPPQFADSWVLGIPREESNLTGSTEVVFEKLDTYHLILKAELKLDVELKKGNGNNRGTVSRIRI